MNFLRFKIGSEWTKAQILKAADMQYGKRDRRAFYDRRRRMWIVEYTDSDPTLYFRATKADDGSIFLESIDG